MYVFDIIIKNNQLKERHDQQYEDWVHGAYNYVYFLERTGQIVKGKHQFSINDNIIRIPVTCPEKDSLSSKYCSEYNLKLIEEMEQNNGSKIETIYIGRDADNPSYIVPKNSSYYILRSGWESPLICGDTHSPIPLYKIPYTNHGGVDYDNIYFWNQDYERLHGLWLSSGKYYEEFAQEQLQDHKSVINKKGHSLCKIIEKLTGVPTYYFLFNYRDWSEEEDKQRKCPITGTEWFIPGKTTIDFMAFKCKKSRLVSELSTNIR